MNIFDIVMDIGFFAAAVRLAVPLLLGTLSELTAERSGVLNLGIEGMMLSGALAGFGTASATGSLWLGVTAAIGVGMLVGALMALLVVTLRLDQTVTGLGVSLMATGLVFYSYRLGFGESSTPPAITPFSTIPLPFLSDIPVIGPVFFNQYALTYLAYLLVPALAFFLYRTPAGLALRSVGENPQAAAAAGIDPIRVRFLALIAAGGLAGLAGAYLNLAAFGSFTFGIIAGRGWICLALVVLGRWNPIACAGAAFLFGAVDALQLRLQASGAVDLPYQLFLALPYAATLVAMILNASRAVGPTALMQPYDAEQR
ncbi:simple sugar transport system permease protein [Mycoplana sp. BE70]|uniref:ABC transporter permease n=1 Tax=Mycoplana sp. BE70 TaxID=2817775 RepID=UPI00285EC85E|nr:ABC transporter permease [Mycoplana sp. BE70]MDR6755131.1 simple sugar transport system permease protein [Mycoplana sp. BE70]